MGRFGTGAGSYPAPHLLAPPAVCAAIKLMFIITIDGNLNGYVKGMEIVWLEIGQVIFFKSHQGLEADYVAVKYNANTWVQGSTVQIFIPRSLVHSQPFFNIGLELIKLPYCYHCLPSICSKILSSHTIVWILATAFRTVAEA